jgi:hypothetical protein
MAQYAFLGKIVLIDQRNTLFGEIFFGLIGVVYLKCNIGRDQ